MSNSPKHSMTELLQEGRCTSGICASETGLFEDGVEGLLLLDTYTNIQRSKPRTTSSDTTVEQLRRERADIARLLEKAERDYRRIRMKLDALREKERQYDQKMASLCSDPEQPECTAKHEHDEDDKRLEGVTTLTPERHDNDGDQKSGGSLLVKAESASFAAASFVTTPTFPLPFKKRHRVTRTFTTHEVVTTEETCSQPTSLADVIRSPDTSRPASKRTNALNKHRKSAEKTLVFEEETEQDAIRVVRPKAQEGEAKVDREEDESSSVSSSSDDDDEDDDDEYAPSPSASSSGVVRLRSRRTPSSPTVKKQAPTQRSKFDFTWDKKYARLVAYAARHGNAFVKQKHVEPDGLRLGKWCGNQRSRYVEGKMRRDRYERLDAIGFWDVAYRRSGNVASPLSH